MRPRGLLLGIVVALVVAGGGTASALELTGSSGPVYRVTTAADGTVQQTFDVVGTIEPVDESTLAFQVAGTVASVDVSVGQQVSAGQTLASLDSTSLASTVSGDQSTLATDQAKLTSDEQTESSQSTPAGGGSGTGSASASAIGKAQQKLVTDQKTADADSARAKSDLQTATSDCGGGSSSTCTADLTQELSDQQLVSQDLSGVAQDEDALAGLLQQESASLTQSAGGAGGRGASGSSGGGATITPATIADDQANIDDEQAALYQAQQALDETTLVSPLAGQVAELSMASGDSVSANSTAQSIVVQGPNSFEVVADVPTSDLAALHTGESALVTPDGTSSVVQGTLSSVDSLPASSADSDAISITLPSGTPGLYNGANAEVSVVTGVAAHALTVPTSALVRSGNSYFVNELTGGTTKRVAVQVGVVGDTLAQLNSGLTAGAQVVLANLSEPVPTSSTNPRSIISLEGGGGINFFRAPGGTGARRTVSGGG